MRIVHNIYDELVKIENIYRAWREFRSGKADKESVREFSHNLEDNLFALKSELDSLTYRHGDYETFTVRDPKLRIIHKAAARDRVVHTLSARALESIYQPRFIAHSYACQKKRGTHHALQTLIKMCRSQSRNYTHNIWYLKCDIKKFFDNIDHTVLMGVIGRTIKDQRFIWLLNEVLGSFHCFKLGVGLPLGNFTSQWLGNIYLNELDYFVKQKLGVKFYIRYADDFALLNEAREILEGQLTAIRKFLSAELKLILHPDKIILKKFTGGIDWVGYKVLPRQVAMKPASARRMFAKLDLRLKEMNNNKIGLWQYYQTVNSYLGQLQHCSSRALLDKIIFNNHLYDYHGKIY